MSNKEKIYEHKINETIKKAGGLHPKYIEKDVKCGSSIWVRNNHYSGWGVNYNINISRME